MLTDECRNRAPCRWMVLEKALMFHDVVDYFVSFYQELGCWKPWEESISVVLMRRVMIIILTWDYYSLSLSN